VTLNEIYNVRLSVYKLFECPSYMRADNTDINVYNTDINNPLVHTATPG